MNIKKSSLALALIATTVTAFAGEFVDHSDFVSTRTRAEVRAELADQSAQQQPARQEFVEYNNVAGGKTRAEVRAELEAAYVQGLLPAHASEFVEHTAIASTRTRDEVRNEAIQAAKTKRVDITRFGG